MIQNKKSIKISFRITEEEKKIMNTILKEQNISISNLCKSAIFDKSFIEKLKFKESIKFLTYDAKLENNINQIAKQLNSGFYFPHDELMKLLEDIRRIREENNKLFKELIKKW